MTIAAQIETMPIGPDAAGMASGRLVVLGTAFIVVGGLAILLGSGPYVTGQGPLAQAVGLLAIAAGLALGVSAWGLLLRRTWGRTAGVIGAVILAVVGSAVAATAANRFLAQCMRAGSTSSTDAPSPCAGLGVVSVAGLLLLITGIVGTRLVLAVSRSYFRGRPETR